MDSNTQDFQLPLPGFDARRKDKRHHTIETYHQLAHEKGQFWIGEKLPKNNKEKTLWQCKSCDNVYKKNQSDMFQSKYGCPKCGRAAAQVSRKVTLDDYITVGQDMGIEWLDNVLPRNTHEKTLWGCSQGHEWNTDYHTIQGNHGCPVCGLNSRVEKRRFSGEDYHLLATNKGIEWIGKETPYSVNDKTDWKCRNGHVNTVSYRAVIESPYGCKTCSIQSRASSQRLTSTDYHNAARNKRLRWIGTEVPPSSKDSKTEFLCEAGNHIWVTSYSSLVHNDNNCPHCSGNAPNTEVDYHEVATKNGYQWIGQSLPKVSKEKTEFLCPKGHVYLVSYKEFSRGRRCTKCQNMINGRFVSSQQEWLCDLVGGDLNIQVAGFCVDIVAMLNNQQIAIEYDGWYWHKDRLEEDERHNRDLIESGWKVLRVKSASLLPDKESVWQAISRLLDGSPYEEIVLPDWGD